MNRFLRRTSTGPRRPSRAAVRLGDLLASPEVFEQIIDATLLGVLFLSPLFMGGRSDLGRCAYFLLVGILALAWTARQWRAPQTEWQRTGVGLLLVAGAGLVAFQLAPLPQAWLHRLSPKIAELLPLWASGQSGLPGLGSWTRVSLTPHATTTALYVYVAHATLFVVLVQHLKTVEDVERTVRSVAIAALAMTGLGLVQYLTGTERFVWVLAHPSRDASRAVCGPFANSNHFAHFLALGIGPLIWWFHQTMRARANNFPTGNVFRAVSSSERERLAMFWAALSVSLVVLAGFLTRSRGGILAMFGASILCGGGFMWCGLLSRRTLLALVAIGALVCANLTVHGTEDLGDELETLTSGSLEDLDQTHGRRRIWAANLAAARCFPLLGTGVGSHAEVYPLFFEHPSEVEFSHAECGYLQVLTETGLVGLGLLLTGIIVLFVWGCRILCRPERVRLRALGIAVYSGIVVSLVHSAIDFPWYLTACMSVAVVLAACACRLAHEPAASGAGGRPLRWGRPLWSFAFMTVLSVFGCGMLILPTRAIASLHWDAYLKRSLAMKHRQSAASVLAQKPADPREQLRSSYEQLRAMAQDLERTLTWDPNHPRANFRMASLLLKLFDYRQEFSANAIALAQIRDAAVNSGFATLEDQNRWLDVAVGENRKLLDAALYYMRHGLMRSPLSGRGYLYWADLSFLEGWKPQQTQALYDQARRVRPNDAAVLFALGREAALSGSAEMALDLWRRSFHQDKEYREAIMAALAPRLAPEAFLHYFSPERAEMVQLFRLYRNAGLEDHARTLAAAIAQQLVNEAGQTRGPEAAQLLVGAVNFFRFVGDPSQAEATARWAVRTAPNQYEPRRILANQLLVNGRHDEAIDHYLWCLRRRPHDHQVKKNLEAARGQRRKAMLPESAGPPVWPLGSIPVADLQNTPGRHVRGR
jgi:tetratricopeptide (TPR) repeat protein